MTAIVVTILLIALLAGTAIGVLFFRRNKKKQKRGEHFAVAILLYLKWH